MNRKNIKAIALREYKSNFHSPIAYIVIVAYLLFTGWFFFGTFFLNNVAELRYFTNLMPIIFSIVIPAITMKSFSEEFNSGSFEILGTLPLKLEEVLLGKFIASVMFVKSLLLPTIFYVLTIEVVGDLDWGMVIGTYIGIILLGIAYSSLGLMTSSLTNNQIVAWILGAFFCFIFTFIGLNNFVALLPDGLGFFFRYLSSSYHIQNISKGVLDFRDLLYFFSFSTIFLITTYIILDNKKK